MAFNLAQVGVDKKSGAPIIQRSSNFIYNNDPNGTRDIFYHFGSRLRSSKWINPNSTSFLTASRLNGGSITSSAPNAVDNNTATSLFNNSTDPTDGFQARFLKAPFKLLDIQLNTNDPNWIVEGSNDGNTWTSISYPGFGNLGNNWFLISLTNNTFYSYYRIVHGEPGFSKTFNTVKFFGEYQSGDIAPGIEENATFLATHTSGPGIVYLPDAGAEQFPENFYTTIVHFKTGEYTYRSFPGGSTSINDNTNGVLRQGEQLLAVFDNGNWELFKVGSGVDLTTKGTILTSNGSETTFLSVGPNGSFLVADSTTSSGLKYQSVNLTTLAPPTSSVDFAGNRITSLGAPVSPSDAVTKNYADSIAAGFDPKASCDVATTGTLASTTGLTWSPSGTGPGKKLTSNGTTATIDTITLQNGLRVLVKDQVNKADNGIYLVSGTGTAVTLTRSTDFDTSIKVTPGAFTFITKGVANGATGFILLGNGTLVIDTNDLLFSQFAGAGAVTVASLPDTNFGTLDAADTGHFIGWNNSTGFFELYERAGTQTGDLVKLVDNNGTAAYPPLDGSLISISPTQISPLTSKGDLWTYGISNTRLPVGADGQLLVASSSTGTGLIWKTITSNDLDIGATSGDVTVNFKTGVNSVELGPLHIDSALSPNENEFLRYDGSKFTAVDPSGLNNGDFVVLEDVNGVSGLPAIDGSQLTNVVVGAGQGSPLNTKGDIYIYDQNSNSRLPIGNDGELLISDSSTTEGLKWGSANLSKTDLQSYLQPTDNLNVENSKGKVTLLSSNVLNLPPSVPANFFTLYKNVGSETINIILLDNTDSIQGNSFIYPQHGGLLIKTDSNTWINLNNPGVLNSKGQVAGFSDKPQALAAGVSGQVLTANNSSEVGFRWENRAGADDLIYSKEFPVKTLNAFTPDIFNNLRVNGSYTYPASNNGVTFTTNTTNGTNNPTALVTQNFSDSLVLNPTQFVAIEFLSTTIQPNLLAVYDTHNNSTDQEVVIEVSTDGTLWTEVGSHTFLAGQISIWNQINLDTNGYFTHLRLVNNSSSELRLNEFKLFGWLKKNPQIGEIFAVGPTGITPVKAEENNQILISDSSTGSGVRWGSLPTQPPLTIETKVEVGDIQFSNYGFNGIINAIATKDGTQSFVNPANNSVITKARINPYGPTDTLTTVITDRNLSGTPVTFGKFGIGTPHTVFTIDFNQNEFVKPSLITIYYSEELPNSGSDPNAGFTLEGSNNGTNFTPLGNLIIGTGNWSTDVWRSIPITQNTNSYWRYLKLVYNRVLGGNSSNQLGKLYEVEVYGNYITSIPTGILNPGDIGKLLLCSDTANSYSLKVPDNNNGEFKQGWYCYVKSSTGNNRSFITQVNQAFISSASTPASLNGPEEMGMLINIDGINKWSFINLSNPNTKLTAEINSTGTTLLNNFSENIQLIDPNGSNREVVLPSSPIKNLYFKIINADASNYNLNIKETVGGPIVKVLNEDTPYTEIHYTGTQYILLD